MACLLIVVGACGGTATVQDNSAEQDQVGPDWELVYQDEVGGIHVAEDGDNVPLVKNEFVGGARFAMMLGFRTTDGSDPSPIFSARSVSEGGASGVVGIARLEPLEGGFLGVPASSIAGEVTLWGLLMCPSILDNNPVGESQDVLATLRTVSAPVRTRSLDLVPVCKGEDAALCECACDTNQCPP